jgi:hypothetical protein
MAVPKLPVLDRGGAARGARPAARQDLANGIESLTGDERRLLEETSRSLRDQ